jgi:hypothetical protein
VGVFDSISDFLEARLGWLDAGLRLSIPHNVQDHRAGLWAFTPKVAQEIEVA